VAKAETAVYTEEVEGLVVGDSKVQQALAALAARVLL
jgi:hypothetical protein